jgi:succinate dehydrogenase / fumarate reductase iron-sulfur subunit
MSDQKTIVLKIKRRKDQESESYWEEFEIPYRPAMNVISCLMEIRKNPVTRDGKATNAPVWDMNCLENVCGSCTMLMNGKVGQSCAALVDNLAQPITLEPMSKFPVIKDLAVDRSRMFENLKKIRGWIPIDGTYDLMTCGSCLEACPQVNPHSNFIGPAAIGQVRLFNSHPTGSMNKEERLDAISGSDGVTSCGNAQNCVKACPKDIPLTKAIAEMNRDVTLYKFKKFFRGK